MDKPDDAAWKLAQSLLRRKVGDSPDPSHPSSRRTAEIVLEELRRELVPLFGSAGFGAVLGRALQETERRLPFLAGIEQVSGEGVEPNGFADKIRALNGLQADDATTAVLANFLGVLVQLLGLDMTRRITKQEVLSGEG